MEVDEQKDDIEMGAVSDDSKHDHTMDNNFPKVKGGKDIEEPRVMQNNPFPRHWTPFTATLALKKTGNVVPYENILDSPKYNKEWLYDCVEFVKWSSME